MDAVVKTNVTSTIQCVLVIVAVWFAANLYANHIGGSNEELAEQSFSHIGLPHSKSHLSNYPENIFKSDKNWKEEQDKLLKNDGNVAISAIGHLNYQTVTMDCIITNDGALIGRYNNPNGVNLDVNGYFDDDDNTLKIRLGHGKEASTMVLTPKENENQDQQEDYIYNGTWGKKARPVKMVFKIK
jgi:hypothetical protein